MDGPEHTLVLLRHAKSDWSGEEADVRRPLARRGQRQAPGTGRWLDGRVGPLDLAVVSSATRARETWELVSAELSQPPRTTFEDRVYAATAGALLEVVRGLPDEARTVVLVGHNPGLEDLASDLAGQWVPLKTSAVAVIALHGPWSSVAPGTGELVESGRPSGRPG